MPDESPEEPDDALGAGDVNNYNNYANKADGNYTYNEDEEVNGFLQLIRDEIEMTVEGIEKNTRTEPSLHSTPTKMKTPVSSYGFSTTTSMLSTTNCVVLCRTSSKQSIMIQC